MSSEQDSGDAPQPGSGPFSQQVQHTSVAARVPEAVGRGVISTAVMVFHTNSEFVIDFLATMVRPPQVVARLVMSPVTFMQLIRGLRTNLEKYEKSFGSLSARQPVQQDPASAGGDAPQQTAPQMDGAETQSFDAMAGKPVAGVGATAGPGEAAGTEQPQVPAEPGKPASQPNRIEDIYEQLKLPDEMLGGVFSNVAMIRHTGEEFCFDFIANFYPRSVVTSRVYMAAGRIPSLLATMTDSFEQFRRKTGGGGPSL
jgi:hypothetical protein